MASVHIETRVEIDDTKLRTRLENLIDDDTMLEVHQVFAEMCDPYVPFRTGQLAGDIVIDADGVTYNVDYAAKNYFGIGIQHNKSVHPLATAYWDKVMLQNVGDVFAERVKEILVRRANELYG